MSNNKGCNVWAWFPPLLQLLFIDLKLCGKIDWKWGWVLAPFWGSAALFAVLFVIGVIIGIIRDRME